MLKTNMTQLGAMFAFHYYFGPCVWVAPSPYCDLGAWGPASAASGNATHSTDFLAASRMRHWRQACASPLQSCQDAVSDVPAVLRGGELVACAWRRHISSEICRYRFFVAFAINAMCCLVQFGGCTLEQCSNVKVRYWAPRSGLWCASSLCGMRH